MYNNTMIKFFTTFNGQFYQIRLKSIFPIAATIHHIVFILKFLIMYSVGASFGLGYIKPMKNKTWADPVFTRLPSRLYPVSLSISSVSQFILSNTSNSHAPTLEHTNLLKLDPDKSLRTGLLLRFHVGWYTMAKRGAAAGF